MASLPFGALRRAQRALARAQVEENSGDSDENPELESEPEEVSVKDQESKPNAHKPEWSNKPRTDIAKRSNKNAWVVCVRFLIFGSYALSQSHGGNFEETCDAASANR